MISFPQGSKGQWNITIGTAICPSVTPGGGSVGTSVCPSRFKPKALTTPSLRKSKVCCVPAATATSADGWATHLNRILQNHGSHLRNLQGFRVETHICDEMDCSRKIFEVLLLTKITLVCLRVVSDLPLRGSNLFREKRSLALFVIYISKQNNSPKLWYLQPLEIKHWKCWCLDASPSAPCPVNVSPLAKKTWVSSQQSVHTSIWRTLQ